MLVIGTMMFVKIGTIDLHAILSTGSVLIPAIIVMGFLGSKIGEIVDNPKNRADADYKLAVLNALKKFLHLKKRMNWGIHGMQFA
jgi:hypothetical protein